MLLQAIKLRRGTTALAALCLMSHQSGEAFVPVVLGLVIDRAVEPRDGSALGLGLVALAVVFVWLSLSWRFGHRLSVKAYTLVAQDFRLRIARRVLDPRGGLQSRTPGELLNIAMSDSERAAGITAVVGNVSAATVALCVAAAILLRVSIPLGLLVLLGLPPLLIAMHYLGRPLEGRASHEQSNAAVATSVATDLVTGLRVLRGIGAQSAAADRYRGASQRSLTSAVRAARLFAAYEGWALLLTGAFLALVAYVGGRLALSGRINIGDLIAALGLTQFLIGPLLRLAYASAAVARARASAGRVAAILSAPAGIEAGAAFEATAGRLELDALSAGGLEDLSITVEGGEYVGVVATHPAKARTLIDVLSLLTPPERGSLRLDGVDLSDVAIEDARRALLVAPHDAVLFAGPLMANFAPWSEDEAAFETVVGASAMDTVFETLPGGRSATVTERGRSLSGGQRQRASLARTLLADPAVLVLHDPTTAIDSVTEARIAAGIREQRRGRTTILVTTSPALLAAADRVVLLIDGRIEADSTHEALLATSAAYREAVA